jgi:hypothetical protein
MAPVYSKIASANQVESESGESRARARMILPPIPLERPERQILEDGNYVSFKLRAVPLDHESQQYFLSVPYFSTGTPESWIIFRKNLDKVLVGQNVTTGPPTYAMARRILEGAALARFEASVIENGTETLEHFALVIEDMGEYVFPRRALQMEKRFMQRYMRKPRKLKMRDFMARVEELNHDLRYFPTFVPGARLLEDELLDIYENGVPNTWQKQFLLQGFDPIEHSKSEFLEFCERLEATEDIFVDKNPRSAKRGRSNTPIKGNYRPNTAGRRTPLNRSNSRNSGTLKYCRLHGQQTSHDTASCKVLLDQADKMKATWKTQPEQYQKKRYNATSPRNASYQRNADNRYNSDNRKRDFTTTERKRTRFEQDSAKRPKVQQGTYMASVSAVASKPTKEETLDLESFNYKDAFSDQLSMASSMDYMTPIDDESPTESDPE